MRNLSLRQKLGTVVISHSVMLAGLVLVSQRGVRATLLTAAACLIADLLLALIWTRRIGQYVDQVSRTIEEMRRKVADRENIMDTIPDIIYLLDVKGNLVHWNRHLEVVTGMSQAELMGQHVYALFATEDRPGIADAIRVGFAQGRFDVEGELLRKDRTTVLYHWRGAPLKDEQGRVVGITGAGRDISDRKSIAEQMAHQAFHDPLTSLPNRALFMDRLAHALVRPQRHTGIVAVMFLDLDRFKVINDSLGHQVGDQLLVAAGQRLQACLRRDDTVARLGGDEFAILLAEIEDFTDATSLADRISERLRAPFVCDGRELFVTASIGIAVGKPGHDQPDEILRDADLAMYQAKHKGKAQYQVFHPSMNTPTRERIELEIELRRAVECGDFQVYYQPQVQLTTGKIVELEALIRWPHPRLGWVAAADFIPLAEETGLIVPIGQWIMEEACRQVHDWQADSSPSEPPLRVSVNLSARQFQHPRLVDEIARSLRRSGLDPTSLKLEITETVMMQDSDSTLLKLQQLKSIGIQLAVDDFGTGYSSLAYLKRFPVDTVKIDGSFVAGLGRSSEDTAIVHAVITVAQALDLTVTAEGVETESQVAQLLALGCDQAQGYYFARPLDADAMGRLLAVGTDAKESIGHITRERRVQAICE
ncbi:MAG: hypothetical protein JWN15_932 [Firmicutes bacterium]|nr:hypothetical protein [Bacillota bacterium]